MRRFWPVRRFWTMPATWLALGVFVAAGPQAQAAGDPSGSAGNSGRISARPAQTFRGWGMSLAWEANDLYGGGRQPARIKDPKDQDRYMDLLFGDPASRLTLGLTVARYNIGGGDDPAHAHMRPDAQMEGYRAGPDAPFDWSRDAPQRRMLQEARKRGANIFEAISFSPPYWMTVSGCSAGSEGGKQDNLRPEMRDSFVDYLATVVRHFRDAEGIVFESIEPFNEPDGGWWRAGGREEGNKVPVADQDVILPMLSDRLKHDGLTTVVAGVDTDNIDAALAYAGQLSAEALGALHRLDTHDYYRPVVRGEEKLRAYRALGKRLHKPIWMSEFGCCLGHLTDRSEMGRALYMADSIRKDLRDMGAEAWLLWQPDWGVIAFDPGGGAPRLHKQYYALAQYTRFIRPGFQIVSAGDASQTLAAYAPSAKRLVLVTTNGEAPARNDLDLTAFTGLPRSLAVYRTTADPGMDLHEDKIAPTQDGHVTDLLPARSITTYVIDGVTPLPDR